MRMNIYIYIHICIYAYMYTCESIGTEVRRVEATQGTAGSAVEHVIHMNESWHTCE